MSGAAEPTIDMQRMPESTARLVFPFSAGFQAVALDSARFYLRKYRVRRRPSDWARRVLERALAPAGTRGQAPGRVRLELHASKSTLRLTLRVPGVRSVRARLRALLQASLPGTSGTIRSLDDAALIILKVPIPEDR